MVSPKMFNCTRSVATKREIPFLISGGQMIRERGRGGEVLGSLFSLACVCVLCESAFNFCTGGQHFRHKEPTRLASTAKVLWHFGLQSVQFIRPSIHLSICQGSHPTIQLSITAAIEEGRGGRGPFKCVHPFKSLISF